MNIPALKSLRIIEIHGRESKERPGGEIDSLWIRSVVHVDEKYNATNVIASKAPGTRYP
jgi:hypothetical protein